MLVLSRNVDQAIILKLPNGEQVDIIVTTINKSQVKIGVDAPDEIEVLREELLFED